MNVNRSVSTHAIVIVGDICQVSAKMCFCHTSVHSYWRLLGHDVPIDIITSCNIRPPKLRSRAGGICRTSVPHCAYVALTFTLTCLKH